MFGTRVLVVIPTHGDNHGMLTIPLPPSPRLAAFDFRQFYDEVRLC